MGCKAIVTDGKRFRSVCSKFREYNYAFICHTEYCLFNADIVQQAIDKDTSASLQEVSLALGILIGRSTSEDRMIIDVYVSDNMVSDDILKMNIAMYNVNICVHRSRSKKSVPDQKKQKNLSIEVDKKEKRLPPVDIGDDDCTFNEAIPTIVSYSTEQRNTCSNDLEVGANKRKYSRHFSDEGKVLLERAKSYSFTEGGVFTNSGLFFLNELIRHKIPMTIISSETGVDLACIYNAKRELSLMSQEEIQALMKMPLSSDGYYDKNAAKVQAVCRNIRGKSPTGNYVEDFEQAMSLKFGKEDKQCVLDAFYVADSFSSFCSLLSASSFSYKSEIHQVEDVYNALKIVKDVLQPQEEFYE